MNSSAPVPRSLHTRALWMLLLANFFWGLSFPVIKALGMTQLKLLPESGTWFITACMVAPRFLLATVVLALLLRKQLGTFSRSEIIQGVLLGLSAGGGMLFQNDGLQFTSASVSAFLTQVYAIMIPAWLALRAWRLPPALDFFCGALVLVGVAILGQFDFHTMRLGRGELETLLCSVFFMGQIFLLERKEYAGNRALPVTLVMFVVEAALFSGMAACTAPHLSSLLVPWTSPAWLTFVLLLTVFCTLGSFVIMNTWQPRITATEAGLIYCIEPVFTALMALFLPGWFSRWAGLDYPNELVTWNLLVGGGLILAANILIQLHGPAKSPVQE